MVWRLVRFLHSPRMRGDFPRLDVGFWMAVPLRTWWFVLAMGSFVTACAGPTPATPDAGPDESGVPVTGTPSVSAEKAQFLATFQPIVAGANDMTLAQFLALHTPANAVQPITPPADPLLAKNMDLVDQKLTLSTGEKAKLQANGFVVSDRLQHDTMAEALLDVFQKDLPVLVTTDAICQALHSSYDDILKTLEQFGLLGIIDDTLAKAQAALPGLAIGAAPDALLAKQDADLYLTVARSLLAGTTLPSLTGAVVDAQVADILNDVAAEQMVDLQLFGSARTLDFSQFTPRGHYLGVPELEHYFRALMWLGRTDLRFAEQDAAGNWQFRPRQLMLAMLLAQAVQTGNAAAGLQSADDLLALMVGPVDYINVAGVQKLVADQKWTTASDIAALTQTQVETLVGQLTGGQYGTQQIASQVLEVDPTTSTPTPLPPSFALLGQRFIIDSYVFSNVTFDRVIHGGQKVERVLPNPLDVLFALGNDQVLPLLQPDFAKFPYWGALNTVRWLVDQHDAAFWQANLYNLWLDSLRQLNPPTTDAAFPFALRTPAWRDKTANTQLGSWAQLRHDTLLYAKQSYTGGVTCAHPGAYVEPYPQFFARMKLLGAQAVQVLGNTPVADAGVKANITKFFTNWQDIMGKLQTAAEHELAGVGTSTDDQTFLKSVISQGNMCGVVYSGWYPTLFFSSDSVSAWKPTIADVHTNPNTGPLPGPDVLHVATGHVSQLILTVDTCTGAETFVGPAFRYHEVDVHEIKRLSDEDWLAELKDGSAPPPPDWTQSFRAQ